MTKKITLPSGSCLEITLMPWERAWEISQTVTKELELLKIEISDLEVFKRDFEDPDFNPLELINLKNPICSLISNKVFISAAKACFEKCTIDNLRINNDTFEKEDKRCDFIPAVYHVLMQNLTPFFSNLLSYFTTKLSEARKKIT